MSLLPILVINFIGTLGFSLVLPFLVFLVTDWGGNALVYGLTGATYSAFQLVGAPVLGRWSDRYGRRRILLLSQTGTLVSWLIFLGAFALPRTELLRVDSAVSGQFVLTLPLVVLIVARALDGLTGGNVSVANAYLADVTTEAQRATAFGRMAVSSNLGFVMAPAIAGVLGATALGPLVPVGAAAAISLIATLGILYRLPESNPCVLTSNPERPNVRKLFGQEQRDCFETRGAPRLSIAQLVRQRGLPALLTMYFLVMLSFNFFYVTFPIFAVGVLGWSLPGTGTFFAVMGLLMVVVQGPVYGWVARRIREQLLIVGGSVIRDVALGAGAAVEGGGRDLSGCGPGAGREFGGGGERDRARTGWPVVRHPGATGVLGGSGGHLDRLVGRRDHDEGGSEKLSVMRPPRPSPPFGNGYSAPGSFLRDSQHDSRARRCKL